MNINSKKLRCISLLLGMLLVISGCTGKAPTGSDFENVTYTMKLDSGSSDSATESSSEQESVSQDNKPDTSAVISTAASSDVSGDPAADETGTQTQKDPTYTANWPVLLNPNGFNINSVSDVQKFSCISERMGYSTFLPSIAYLENGVAKDVMFDGMAFIPSPNFVHDYGSEEGIKAMNQKDWENYIYTHEFLENYNIDALDATVGAVKTALDMPEYKVGVFLTILKPSSRVTDWGEINGKTLNFKESEEDKVTALKWFVDEQIKVFNERNYKNIELCGFYYYNEYLYLEDKPFVGAITDYVRSRKYITIFAPFYRAKGYDQWAEYGFDRASMQANFFPGTTLPNNGDISRISSANSIITLRKMGLEMEICGTTPQNLSGIKQYFNYGMKLGFMHKYHTWWIMGGPVTVRTLYRSSDPYIHSVYREMYLFIHEKLAISDLTLE